MRKNNTTQKTIFFAYESQKINVASSNTDAIKKTVNDYNNYQNSYKAETWEDYKISGSIINETILDAINNAAIFACDLSTFNHNVIFELGYAVANNKKIFLLLNPDIEGVSGLYRKFILENIQYISFKNAKDIHKNLQNQVFEDNLLDKLINLNTTKLSPTDIFYIQSKYQDQASIELTDYIISLKNNDKYKIELDNSSEIEYRELSWYFSNIYKTTSVVIHFICQDIKDSHLENAKCAFYAGLALGLDKNVLLVAPSNKYDIPLDYKNITIKYSNSSECIKKTEQWLLKYQPLNQIENKNDVTENKKNQIDYELNLLKLGIGCEIAEEEQKELLNYFIENEAYNIALKKTKSIFIGRKGTGKSAIFFKLLHELSLDNKNYIIQLKPESDELLDDIELSKIFNNRASQKRFFFTVWKLVIYSKLLISITNKILIKERSTYTLIEEDIISFFEEKESLTTLNFFGMIKSIYVKNKSLKTLESPEVLNDIYSEYLSKLTSIIKNYFFSISYFKIIILADNLDKAWDAESDLDIQSEMILTLLELQNKIKTDFKNKKNVLVEVQKYIFLRNDIFYYIKNKSRGPDKLGIHTFEIKWDQHSNLIKKLIESRFKYILELNNNEAVQKVWTDYFDFLKTKDAYEKIKDAIIIRPRDIIYFVSKLFESAINNDHAKANDEDFYYAIDTYGKFLHNNLYAELKAIFPNLENIVNEFRLKYGDYIEYKKFKEIITDNKYTNDEAENLIKELFEKGYFIAVDEKRGNPIFSYNSANIKLKERKFLFFPNTVYLIPHEKYSINKKVK